MTKRSSHDGALNTGSKLRKVPSASHACLCPDRYRTTYHWCPNSWIYFVISNIGFQNENGAFLLLKLEEEEDGCPLPRYFGTLFVSYNLSCTIKHHIKRYVIKYKS